MAKMNLILWSALDLAPRVSVVEVHGPLTPEVTADAVAWQRERVPGDYGIEVLGTDDAEGLRRLGEGIVNLVEATGLASVDLEARDASAPQRGAAAPRPKEPSAPDTDGHERHLDRTRR